MDIQLIIIIALVGAAGVFFVVRAIRLFTAKEPKGCCGGGGGKCPYCKDKGGTTP
ncbi:MAG: hypothetical protein LBT01_03230 [Spirochaetaceae bacterium]|nr:hypothetical protein [Spirochaetaceae bacterium]